jgi:hypothetical protein
MRGDDADADLYVRHELRWVLTGIDAIWDVAK